jgi:hypothetical protein
MARSTSIHALFYDTTLSSCILSTNDRELALLDPRTGATQVLAIVRQAASPKGIVEDGAGGLLAVSREDTGLYRVDRDSGMTTELGPLTLAGLVLQNCTGMARDPLTGTLYVVAKEQGVNARWLTTLDIGSLVLTPVASLGDRVAGVAFAPDGTLYAVTGDMATNPSELFRVNKATGARTFVMALGAGDDGEAIATVPAAAVGGFAVAAVNGLATFPALAIDAPGAGFTLAAEAPGVAPALSAPFDVAP